MCFNLILGGNTPDRLDPGGMHHLIAPLILQCGARRFCQGIVPAHPHPACGSEDSITPEVLGEGLGSVLTGFIRSLQYRLFGEIVVFRR